MCNEKENVPLVLEGLLQSVVLTATPSQARCQFETVSNFIQHLLKKKKPRIVWQPTVMLMQQLLTKSIERTENRQKISQLATSIIVKMPKQLRNCVVKWVFMYLAFSERATHRLMALEFFLHLLQERELEDCPDNELVDKVRSCI